jgi:hypothetical protein
MPTQSIQAPAAVVMIRPRHFHPNPQTAADNAFQRSNVQIAPEKLAEQAYREVSEAAEHLDNHGVRVHVFEDPGDRHTPDSVFPNNWFSTHAGGLVAIYPMYAPSRRRERRSDVIEMLKTEYRVQEVIDYSCLEPDGLFLEGTGAMVLDHINRVAYTARSNRSDPIALERFCTHSGFEPMAFDTTDPEGRSIYHTNVMMCVATDFAMAGFELISNPVRREEIRARLGEYGREVIDLDHSQIRAFAGNVIELTGRDGRILAVSETANRALSQEQRTAIERSAKIVALGVPTIELSGGSVRCMLAGIHLSQR